MDSTHAVALPPGPPPRGRGIFALPYYLNFIRDPIGFVGSRFDTYGDVYLAPAPVKGEPGLFVMKHPEHIREVLITQASKFRRTHSSNAVLSRFLGEGLLTTDGAVWQRQRRMLQPAFSKGRLASYAQIMSEEAARTVATWRDGDERDMSVEMAALTLRVVSRSLFGHDVTGDVAVVAAAMRTFQQSMEQGDIFPQWMPLPFRKRVRLAVESLDSIMERLIDERRRNRGASHADLLEALVTAVDEEGDGRGLSVREVRDQLVTLFLAGHETTSQALTWTLYLLSQNRDADRALERELDHVLGERVPTFDDVARLPYTEQVLKEAMRIYPPAHIVARRAEEETRIGAFRVPAGSEVVLWIYHTHHDARWFPEPERFRPERFAPEAEAELPKLAYLPFGSGPHACIGRSFAMMEAVLLMSAVKQKFRFELAPHQRVAMQPRITLVPKYGMRMRLAGR
jgi:cytochrome P450